MPSPRAAARFHASQLVRHFSDARLELCRMLTRDDSVEFFNVVLGTKLTANEKADLVAFLRCL